LLFAGPIEAKLDAIRPLGESKGWVASSVVCANRKVGAASSQ